MNDRLRRVISRSITENHVVTEVQADNIAETLIRDFGLTNESHRIHALGSAIELDETPDKYNKRVQPRTVNRFVSRWE